MPRTAAKKSSTAKSATTSKKKKATTTPAKKAKVISHTDDGTPIVNASMAQIRKGLTGKATQQLVRIPQVAERSKFYAEAAEVIGERESLALPYHGSRMWKCEVKVSDGNGAYGDNRKVKQKASKKNDNSSGNDDEVPKKKKTNYKSLTPLFRWYRGQLILATLPYILDDIVEVENKMAGKKRWANGLSDDELDSSDDEWDDDVYKVEPTIQMTMDVSALTTSAYEDTSHPMPHVSRSWISPDLQRFNSRKSAMAHAQVLIKRDQLIDRTMFGYGHNGVRLRPVKPTRKQALEAGMARFLRDGLWIVGQEEAWVEKRREVLVKKQEKRMLIKTSEDETEEGDGVIDGEEKNAAGEDGKEAKSEEVNGNSSIEEVVMPTNSNEEMKKASIETIGTMLGNNANSTTAYEEKKEDDDDTTNDAAIARAAAGLPDLPPRPVNNNASKPPACEGDAKLVSESDASTEGIVSTIVESINTGDNAAAAPKKAIVKRAPAGTRPPPAFVPSTHYRMNQDQITRCYAASLDHYEKVMNTVRARSLHHELTDGFDVFRERGRGRYDMELPIFDTDAFSFLTDVKKAAWMPIVHKILGEDALLIHKGCFLSLPGAETQVYHQDGLHLNKKTHKPCYAINVFIPLVDYDMTNGPTEFCLGTHYLGHENFVKENVYTPIVTAGTPVIFDYRLGHRGLGNNSQHVRPVVYLTYSSSASGKEFRDSVNFGRKYFRKLGELVDAPLSREERAKRRRMA